MKRDSNIGWSIIKFILIVLAIAFIIITVGSVIKSSPINLNGDNDPKKEEDEPNHLEEEKKKKLALLQETNDRIKYVEEKKESVLKREKYVFISARLLVGILLITANVLYLRVNNWGFALDKLMDLNGAIVLCYSFVAFVAYGTPSRFVNALKGKISYFLKYRHIELVEELGPLKEKQRILTEEIEQIDLKLSNEVKVEEATSTDKLCEDERHPLAIELQEATKIKLIDPKQN